MKEMVTIFFWLFVIAFSMYVHIIYMFSLETTSTWTLPAYYLHLLLSGGGIALLVRYVMRVDEKEKKERKE